MDDGFTVVDRLSAGADEKVALVRISDGRPSVLTVLPGGTIGDGRPLAVDPLAYWTVPTSTDATVGDLLVWREVAWELTDRCEPPHAAWAEYAEWAVTWAKELGLDPAMTVGHNEVWAARRLSRSELARRTERRSVLALEHAAGVIDGLRTLPGIASVRD